MHDENDTYLAHRTRKFQISLLCRCRLPVTLVASGIITAAWPVSMAGVSGYLLRPRRRNTEEDKKTWEAHERGVPELTEPEIAVQFALTPVGSHARRPP